MSTAIISLVMDIAVMCALGGTIYYMMRLSKGLASFKSSRDDLRLLIQELSTNIDQAQKSIEGLKKTSNVAADNLDGVLHESKKMATEMKFINETSEALAGRLEKLAEKNRKVAESMNYAPPPSFEPDPDFPAQSYRPASASRVDAPSFLIQDRDFEEEDDSVMEEPKQFSSQAEKDLFEALQRNKKKTGGGR